MRTAFAMALAASLAGSTVALAQTAEDVQRAIDDGRVIVVDSEQMAQLQRDAPPLYDAQQLERQMAGARMIEEHRRAQERERSQLRLVWAVLLLLGAGVAVARTLAKKNAGAAAATPATDAQRSDAIGDDAIGDDGVDDEEIDEEIDEDGVDEDGVDDEHALDDADAPEGRREANPDPGSRYDDELDRLLED